MFRTAADAVLCGAAAITFTITDGSIRGIARTAPRKAEAAAVAAAEVVHAHARAPAQAAEEQDARESGHLGKTLIRQPFLKKRGWIPKNPMPDTIVSGEFKQTKTRLSR